MITHSGDRSVAAAVFLLKLEVYEICYNSICVAKNDVLL